MKAYRNKIVAITGASSGIGLACARLFAREGWTVYNLSRRPCGIAGVREIQTDVTREESVLSAFAGIREESGALGLLISNAGIGISGAVEFTEAQEAKRQFDVNFFGALYCVKAALPMLKESAGRILFISSAAAVFSIPFQSFYSASKAALNALAGALANELSLFGVSVCALQLGDVASGFTAARAKSEAGDGGYGGAIARSVAVMERDEKNGTPPAVIARRIYRIAMKNKVGPVRTLGMKYRLLVFLAGILPNAAVNRMVGLLYMK